MTFKSSEFFHYCVMVVSIQIVLVLLFLVKLIVFS